MSNKLALTRQALTEAKDLGAVFELEAFRGNFALNYLKTTGKDNGEMIFEREKILFMKAVGDNAALQKCDRFSVYSSFIELAVSGLTLNDGLSYIIPYKDKAQFQVGWKGRLEQISQMPEVAFVNQPQVVYEADEFDYELGEVVRIIKHKPSPKRAKGEAGDITHVYLILDTKFGKKAYLMDRAEVLKIRDQYSAGYKSYVAEVEKQGKKPGEKVTKSGKRADGSTWSFELEAPFWVTSEDEAFKKTLVKRVYKNLPKTPRLKALDAKLAEHYDKEDGTTEETHDIDYGLAEEVGTKPAQQIAAGKNDSPQVTQMKAEAAPLVEKMKEKGQVSETPKTRKKAQDPAPVMNVSPTNTPGETVDTDSGEINPEVNPVDELPPLGDLGGF
jgi:phage RecT family recombinase